MISIEQRLNSFLGESLEIASRFKQPVYSQPRCQPVFPQPVFPQPVCQQFCPQTILVQQPRRNNHSYSVPPGYGSRRAPHQQRSYSHRDHSNPHKEMNPSDRLLIVFISGIALCAGSYLLGKNSGDYSAAQDGLRAVDDFKRDVIPSLYPVEHDALTEVAEAREKIFLHIKSQARWRLAITVSMLAAGTLGLAGAITASIPLVTAGAAIGGATLLVQLFRWGLASTDRSYTSGLAEKLDRQIKLAEQRLEDAKRNPHLYNNADGVESSYWQQPSMGPSGYPPSYGLASSYKQPQPMDPHYPPSYGLASNYEQPQPMGPYNCPPSGEESCYEPQPPMYPNLYL